MKSNPRMQSCKSPRYKRTRKLRSRLAAFPVQAHDQAVSKSVEQKPEIIPGQILSGSQFNKPLANEPLVLCPLSQRPQDMRRFPMRRSRETLDRATPKKIRLREKETGRI